MASWTRRLGAVRLGQNPLQDRINGLDGGRDGARQAFSSLSGVFGRCCHIAPCMPGLARPPKSSPKALAMRHLVLGAGKAKELPLLRLRILPFGHVTSAGSGPEPEGLFSRGRYGKLAWLCGG